jgi:hypothetical protein
MCNDNIGLQCWNGYCVCNSSQYFDYTTTNSCGKNNLTIKFIALAYIGIICSS